MINAKEARELSKMNHRVNLQKSIENAISKGMSKISMIYLTSGDVNYLMSKGYTVERKYPDSNYFNISW